VNRQKLDLALREREEGLYVRVNVGGWPAILSRGPFEPGFDLLVELDRTEKFIRLVGEGGSYEGAYTAAYPVD